MTKLVKLREVAEMMGVSKGTLEWRTKKIAGYNFPKPSGMIGRAYGYNLAEIKAFINVDNSALFKPTGRKPGTKNIPKIAIEITRSYLTTPSPSLSLSFLSRPNMGSMSVDYD